MLYLFTIIIIIYLHVQQHLHYTCTIHLWGSVYKCHNNEPWTVPLCMAAESVVTRHPVIKYETPALYIATPYGITPWTVPLCMAAEGVVTRVNSLIT